VRNLKRIASGMSKNLRVGNLKGSHLRFKTLAFLFANSKFKSFDKRFIKGKKKCKF